MTAVVALVIFACPHLSPGPWLALPEGCPAPRDGVLWTFDGDADREAELANLGVRLSACHSGCLADISECSTASVSTADALDECASALDDALDDVSRVAGLVPPPGLPSWSWAAAGAAGPLAALGACGLAGCSHGAALAYAGATGAVVVMAAWVGSW